MPWPVGTGIVLAGCWPPCYADAAVVFLPIQNPLRFTMDSHRVAFPGHVSPISARGILAYACIFVFEFNRQGGVGVPASYLHSFSCLFIRERLQ